jgi:hypothetical protein
VVVHRTLAAGLAALVAAAIAGCGSTGHSAGGGGYAAVVAYARCMRAHGVTSFPDPSPQGGFELPSTIDPQAPAYRSADHACSHLAPAPIARRTPSERQKLMAVAFSRCVRRRGIAAFPDPTVGVPAPASAHGIVRGGLYWPLAPGIVQSPAFKAAAAACGMTVTGGASSPVS